MTQETRETPQQAVRGDTAHDTAPPDWLSLASRCEAAKGADREIDVAILSALGWTYENVADGCFAWLDGHGGIVASTFPLTASIDAITSLIEMELPGSSWFAGKGRTRPDEPLGGARIFADEAGDCLLGQGEAPTPALALCAAFCRATHKKGARS